MITSVLSSWGALVIAGLVSIVLTPLLIGMLGDHQFGLWVLATSFLEYYGLLDFGLRTAVQRHVALSRGGNDRVALNEIFITSLAMTGVVVLVAAALSLVLAGIVPMLAPVRGSGLTMVRYLIVLLGLSTAITFATRILGAYLTGLQRFDLDNLGTSLMLLVRGTLIVVVLSQDYGILGCAGVTLFVSVVSMPAYLGLVRRADPQLTVRLHHVSWSRARQLMSYSLHAFLNLLGGHLRFYSDSIVIAWLIGVASIPYFNVASRLMEMYKSGLYAVTQPLMSRMSRLAGQNCIADMRELFLCGTRATALLTLLVGSIFWLHGRAILRGWVGSRFESSYPILMVLTVGYAIALVQSPSVALLFALGRHRALGWWTLAEGVLNAVVSVYGALHWGLIGVAVGTTVPMIVSKLTVQPWYALRVVGIGLGRYLTEALLRPVFACAAFLALAWFAFPIDAGAGRWETAQTILLEICVFAPLAYWIGLLPVDKQSIRALLERQILRLKQTRLSQ